MNVASRLGYLFGRRRGVSDATEIEQMRSRLAALIRSQAVIEFDLDGTILSANERFLFLVGYRLDEITGKHHSLFIEADYRDAKEYQAFWAKLRRGEYEAGVFKRVGKHAKEIWIQASYNPVLDATGRPVKVIKVATDVTDQMIRQAESQSRDIAISKSQGVIEFELNGTILAANENFLNLVGYSLNEIVGKHHSVFVRPLERQSVEYQRFWAKLGRGEYDAGRYLRLGKGGKEIWIQASYNPILDQNGNAYKVIKYATDVTEQVLKSQQLQAAVHETQSVVKQSIAGDLTARIELLVVSGEVAQMVSDVNALLNARMVLVGKVKSLTVDVRGASEEIARGNDTLSRATADQAASVEQTASSMEEMTSTVKITADNAAMAASLASAARQQAEVGSEVMTCAVAAMEDIRASSKRISDIISVIDAIAFQTNLLALNAAVEAARAGEEGRGFAVVASEVRSLAGRSASAAKEIKSLIQDSVSSVQEGTKLVDESGKTLTGIMASIKKVNDLVAEIAVATRQQSAGIEQVNQAVIKIDQATQQNAALVEQTAAASQSIVDQMESLHSIVVKYRTEPGGGGTQRSTKAA